MKFKRLAIIPLFLGAFVAFAQEKPTSWDLNSCIQYALSNNLQIQKAKISQESAQADTKQAKSQLLPSLSANIGQNLNATNSGSNTLSYTGSYGISSSLTLFDGGKQKNTIEEQELNERIARCTLLATEKSLQMSILQTYAKILYAEEAVLVYQKTVEKSEMQLNRGKEMLAAGSISKPDLALLESQLSSDKYQLVSARNTLASSRLELKQLLELDPGEEISLVLPDLSHMNVLSPLNSLQSVYETALQVMPQIQTAKIGLKKAGLTTESALAGYLPKVNLNGSASTGHSSIGTSALGNQLSDGLNAGVGVSISVPIFTNRQNKTAVQKARLNQQTVQLELQDSEKSLLKEIESVYQDALSSQSQYLAASEKAKAMQTSYELIEQQFNLGMKNPLDLLTEKNNLLAAQQNQLQYKYLSIIAVQILNLYQNLPVTLN